MQNNLPKVCVIATGGTIAGGGGGGLDSTHYQAGTLDVSSLITQDLQTNVIIDTKVIAQIDSVEIQKEIWVAILDFLSQNNANYDGFVITHGTDTMEESAFALDMCYRGDKPVVLVGGMRPPCALGSDSLKNLSNALALAASNLGGFVAVVMNDKIFSPKTIYKAHTYNVDAFACRNGGEMGYILDRQIIGFNAANPRNHPVFESKELLSGKRVEIVYIYAGIKVENIAWLADCNVSGIVVAGCGAGNMPDSIKAFLSDLYQKGVMVVVGSRGSHGFVAESDFVPAFGLSVPKAKILLELCLARNLSPKEIQEIFAYF
ncbi:hypothetical protein BBW65_02810 [Helicobacter enhydrae]|uniref:Probable L-asparaginase n=1 Tax=Helicobacter enhydrae TaxID=222136 RepID=A0A1B1U4X0_9HELI|nr:asparaginase [Helicobacter enhydrae]ANV97798.1 hypothetical protein BBW65_02810 [Helicobacter enhydrae]